METLNSKMIVAIDTGTKLGRANPYPGSIDGRSIRFVQFDQFIKDQDWKLDIAEHQYIQDAFVAAMVLGEIKEIERQQEIKVQEMAYMEAARKKEERKYARRKTRTRD